MLGDTQIAWYMTNISMSVMLATIGALLMAEMAGVIAGIIGFGILLLFPTNVVTVWWGCSEVPWGAFLLAGMWVLARCRRSQSSKRRLGFALLSGFFFGFAALIRPPGLLMWPLAALMCARDRRGWSWREPALVTLGFALAIGPWTLRNWVVQGHRFVLISTNGGEVFFATNRVQGNPQWGGDYLPEGHRFLRSICPDEVDRDRLGYVLGVREVLGDIRLFLRSLPYRYDSMWSTHLTALSWVQLSTDARKTLTALLLLSYWTVPALFLVNARQVWILAREQTAAALLAGVYVMYMTALIPFEVFERTHYPFFLFPLMLAVAALVRARLARSEAHADVSRPHETPGQVRKAC